MWHMFLSLKKMLKEISIKNGGKAPSVLCMHYMTVSLHPNYMITRHMVISFHTNKAITIGVLLHSVYVMVSAH